MAAPDALWKLRNEYIRELGESTTDMDSAALVKKKFASHDGIFARGKQPATRKIYPSTYSLIIPATSNARQRRFTLDSGIAPAHSESPPLQTRSRRGSEPSASSSFSRLQTEIKSFMQSQQEFQNAHIRGIAMAKNTIMQSKEDLLQAFLAFRTTTPYIAYLDKERIKSPPAKWRESLSNVNTVKVPLKRMRTIGIQTTGPRQHQQACQTIPEIQKKNVEPGKKVPKASLMARIIHSISRPSTANAESHIDKTAAKQLPANDEIRKIEDGAVAVKSASVIDDAKVAASLLAPNAVVPIDLDPIPNEKVTNVENANDLDYIDQQRPVRVQELDSNAPSSSDPSEALKNLQPPAKDDVDIYDQTFMQNMEQIQVVSDLKITADPVSQKDIVLTHPHDIMSKNSNITSSVAAITAKSNLRRDALPSVPEANKGTRNSPRKTNTNETIVTTGSKASDLDNTPRVVEHIVPPIVKIADIPTSRVAKSKTDSGLKSPVVKITEPLAAILHHMPTARVSSVYADFEDKVAIVEPIVQQAEKHPSELHSEPAIASDAPTPRVHVSHTKILIEADSDTQNEHEDAIKVAAQKASFELAKESTQMTNIPSKQAADQTRAPMPNPTERVITINTPDGQAKNPRIIPVAAPKTKEKEKAPSTAANVRASQNLPAVIAIASDSDAKVDTEFFKERTSIGSIPKVSSVSKASPMSSTSRTAGSSIALAPTNKKLLDVSSDVGNILTAISADVTPVNISTTEELPSKHVVNKVEQKLNHPRNVASKKSITTQQFSDAHEQTLGDDKPSAREQAIRSPTTRAKNPKSKVSRGNVSFAPILEHQEKLPVRDVGVLIPDEEATEEHVNHYAYTPIIAENEIAATAGEVFDFDNDHDHQDLPQQDKMNNYEATQLDIESTLQGVPKGDVIFEYEPVFEPVLVSSRRPSDIHISSENFGHPHYFMTLPDPKRRTSISLDDRVPIYEPKRRRSTIEIAVQEEYPAQVIQLDGKTFITRQTSPMTSPYPVFPSNHASANMPTIPPWESNADCRQSISAPSTMANSYHHGPKFKNHASLEVLPADTRPGTSSSVRSQVQGYAASFEQHRVFHIDPKLFKDFEAMQNCYPQESTVDTKPKRKGGISFANEERLDTPGLSIVSSNPDQSWLDSVRDFPGPNLPIPRRKMLSLIGSLSNITEASVDAIEINHRIKLPAIQSKASLHVKHIKPAGSKLHAQRKVLNASSTQHKGYLDLHLEKQTKKTVKVPVPIPRRQSLRKVNHVGSFRSLYAPPLIPISIPFPIGASEFQQPNPYYRL